MFSSPSPLRVCLANKATWEVTTDAESQALNQANCIRILRDWWGICSHIKVRKLLCQFGSETWLCIGMNYRTLKYALKSHPQDFLIEVVWVGAWTLRFNKFPQWKMPDFRAKAGKYKMNQLTIP